MRRRFFVERFDRDAAVLRGAAAEHLGRVLRAEAGQLYELSDGRRVWLARVESVALPRRGDPEVRFALLEPVESREPSLALHLLLSVVKFDRFEWCLEKATELGAAEIFPLASARCDAPLLAAAEKRRARWQKILLESAQQSRRLGPPALAGMARPAQVFVDSRAALKILLSERPEAPPLREIVAAATRPASAALAIGPEGGWTGDEIAAARSAGFAEASLGETILRTETAVVAALAVLRFGLS